jgi:hypothetical protein
MTPAISFLISGAIALVAGILLIVFRRPANDMNNRLLEMRGSGISGTPMTMAIIGIGAVVVGAAITTSAILSFFGITHFR